MNPNYLKYATLLVALFLSASLNAEKYKISLIENGSSVVIGGKKLKKNDVFDSEDRVSWQKFWLRIHAKSIRSGRERVFLVAELMMKGMHSLQEAMQGTTQLATKGQSVAGQQDYFLMASIHIPAGDVNSNLQEVAEWKTGDGQLCSTPLYRTPDNRFYIVTPDIYKGHTPPDSLFLTIRRLDAQGSFEEPLFKDLKVFYVEPKKTRKKKK